VRLAHFADPHLGVRQYHRQTPSGINQREADVARAFRLAVDGVIAARPDAIVVAGDLFHSVRPTNAAILFAFKQFQRLRESMPEAPIVLVAGNHDTPRSAETGSILRLFEELGVDVAVDEARRLEYPAIGLSVLAVPHHALVATERPELRPHGGARHRLMVLHGEIEGVLPTQRHTVEYGGALVGLRELGIEAWSYVALGHYHVQHEVAPNAWYSGSLEYVGTNLWGELADEAEQGIRGKGWLLADLERGTVVREPVPASRPIIDLDPVRGEGLGPEALNKLIEERLRAIPGGVADRLVRLRVYDVPRHVARELDHSAIRAYKAEALHLNLDIRRPEVHRAVGVGAPGRRQTLAELVRTYLGNRPLPAELDREAFVRLGGELMDAVERDLAGA
jgi:DNA repair exonuclease SbcCD nuclease subunit